MGWLTAERAELVAQTQELKTQLESQLAQAKREKDLTGLQMAANAAHTAALEQQLQEVNNKLAAATNQADELVQAKQQQAALQEQITAANRQMQVFQTSRADLESQVAQLQVQLQDQVDSTELQNRLTEQKRRYETLVASKQNQVTELQRLVEVLQSQGQEGTARAQDVLEHEQQTTRLSQQLAQAQRDMEILRQSRREIEQALADQQSQLTIATQAATDLQQDIADQKSQHEAALAKLHLAYQDQLNQERAAAQTRLDQTLEQAAVQTPSQPDMQAQLEAQLSEYKTGFAARLRELHESYEAKIAQERHLADEQLAQAQAQAQAAVASAATAVAPAAPSAPADFEKTIAAWEERVTELQTERDALLGVRVELEEASAKQAAEAQQSQATLESTIGQLRQRCEALQAEKARLEQQPSMSSSMEFAAEPSVTSDAMTRQRRMLLERVRKQRHRLWAFRETQKRLEDQWSDIAKQREQLKTRNGSLEQVKRLLEKQELVMARKLADHSALKTVAAVGIFAIMILGATFFGVYQFVSPTYRSEANVKLATNGAAATDPVKFINSPEVVNAAWEHLANDEHYNVQTEHDAFVGTLADNLNVKVDSTAQQVTIQYTGPSKEGVAQVCNQLALAYVTTSGSLGDAGTSPTAQAAKLQSIGFIRAVAPSLPIRDNRLKTFLSISAAAMCVSLLAVMAMRLYIRRQLREIDRMADDEDLENLNDDMPLDTQPT